MWDFLRLDRFPRSLATVSLLMLVIAATALASFVVVTGLLEGTGIGTVPEPTSVVQPTPVPGEWAALVASSHPSTVAVQTFQGGRIIRSGSGTVVSSDGLIATVIDVVPYVAGANVQVSVPGQVYRAAVVARDIRSNVALLKIDATALTTAPFVRSHPPVGTPLALVGGIVELSAYRPLFAHAWLSYDTDAYSSLDAVFQPVLGGSRVLVPGGQQAGIAFLRGTEVRMVTSENIRRVIDTYLDSLAPAP